MLTRLGVTHQYGYSGYYAEPYHVLMLSDRFPASDTQPRPDTARWSPVPLHDAVTSSGLAGFRPYLGMDPSDPGTWPRPYNPQQGMFARLHEDTARASRREGKGVRRG